MTLPSAALRRRTLFENLIIDLISAIGFGVAVAVLAGLLPSIARRSGIEPIGLAALSAAPYAANVVAVVAGRVRLHRPVDVVAVRVVAYLPLLLIPVLPPVGWIVVALVFWIGNSVAAPLQLRLWGLIYPSRERGRIVSVIRTGQAAAIGSVVFIGGALADVLGGSAVVAAGGVVAIVCALAYLRLRLDAAALAAEPPLRYTTREAVQALSARPRLRRLVLAQGMWGAGMIAAGPLYTLVVVDSLRLPLAQIGALGLVGSITGTVSYLFWGHISDRRGGVAVLALGAGLAAPVPALFAVAVGRPEAFGIWLVLVASAMSGLSTAANDIGQMLAISDMTTLNDRRMVLAGWSSVTGIRGIAAPIVSASLVQAQIVDLRMALVGCCLMQVAGLLLFVRTAMHEPARSPTAVR